MLRLTVMPPNFGPGSFSTMKHEMPSSVRAASATMPGALAVGHPHLRAGDHVLLAVAHGAARDVARVAARVGLRQRQAAAELARREARQPALLLLVGAVVHDEVRGDRVRVDDARQRHPAVGELLDDADVGEEVEPEAAVLLGDRDAEQAERLHLLDDRRSGYSSACSISDATGTHLARDEAAHGVDHLVADLGIGRAVMVGAMSRGSDERGRSSSRYPRSAG